MRAPLSAALALLFALGATETRSQPAAPPAGATQQPVVTSVGANLNISPKRITFDKNRRSGTVYIYNQGTAPATFDISLIDRVMLPDGQILATSELVAKPEAKPYIDQLKSAKDVLLISPRRATLAPGQGQTIRIRVASVPEGAAGEYRSHITVTTIPPPSVGFSAEQAAAGQPNQLSFQITSVFGISIPAIVRYSDADVRGAIENARVDYADLSLDGKAPKRTPVMTFDLVRVGASSLFGNIEIRSLTQKSAQPIGFARGIGVYPEIQRRVVHIPLTRAPSSGEKLEITFTDDDTSPGKLLAKLDL